MIDYNNVISVIRDNEGFKSNDNDSSYYRIYFSQNSKPIQVRVSDHGTHLWTWDENGEYTPSQSVNICVVFMSGAKGYSKPNTSVDMAIKDNMGNIIGQKKEYEIVEYVYDCDKLSDEDCAEINKAIAQIPTKKRFIDPFGDSSVKHCSIYYLRPNTPSEQIK